MGGAVGAENCSVCWGARIGSVPGSAPESQPHRRDCTVQIQAWVLRSPTQSCQKQTRHLLEKMGLSVKKQLFSASLDAVFDCLCTLAFPRPFLGANRKWLDAPVPPKGGVRQNLTTSPFPLVHHLPPFTTSNSFEARWSLVCGRKTVPALDMCPAQAYKGAMAQLETSTLRLSTLDVVLLVLFPALTSINHGYQPPFATPPSFRQSERGIRTVRDQSVQSDNE